MSVITLPRPTVNPDTRAILFHGVHINGQELARIQSASRRAYLSRVGSPYDPAVDQAMDDAGRAELDRIQAEWDAGFDAMADEAAMLDRYTSGYCL
jgi:hypothetical protein